MTDNGCFIVLRLGILSIFNSLLHTQNSQVCSTNSPIPKSIPEFPRS